MTLGEQQRQFTRDLAALITFVATLPGHEVALGEVERRATVAAENAAKGAGISNSLHLSRLAADLHLYIYGQYQTQSAAHKPLSDFWKSIRPGNAWGGDFTKPDGNHYSSTYQGRK